MTKVLIAGSRTFKNYTLFKERCDFFLSRLSDFEIVSGGADGADTLAYVYAEQKKYKFTEFPAPWNDIEDKDSSLIGVRRTGEKYWKGAGHARNIQMAEYVGKEGFALIFWDGSSKGTADMIELCGKYRIKCKIIRYGKK